MGSVTYFAENHPEVGFTLHPTEDRYKGCCTFCGHEEEIFPVVDDPNLIDLVTAWQRIEHFHK